MSKNSTSEATAPKDAPAKAGIFARLRSYLHDVRLELKRVVWPSRPEILNSSVVVIITLVFFIAFIYLVDTAIVPVLLAFTKLG